MLFFHTGYFLALRIGIEPWLQVYKCGRVGHEVDAVFVEALWYSTLVCFRMAIGRCKRQRVERQPGLIICWNIGIDRDKEKELIDT